MKLLSFTFAKNKTHKHSSILQIIVLIILVHSWMQINLIYRRIKIRFTKVSGILLDIRINSILSFQMLPGSLSMFLRSRQVNQVQGYLIFCLDKDIYNFQAAFTSQTLQPFFSSEPKPTQVFQPCRKLVGKNFDSFLALQAPIKIVYLYTEQESCSICGEMLRGFADIAEKLYRQDVIAFGYFDIFKNDHAKIPSQVAPYFLVFNAGEDEPYGIEGEQFPQLQNALINIIAEHIYPEYKDAKVHNDEINPDDLTQLQDLKDLEISSRQQAIGTNYEL